MMGLSDSERAFSRFDNTQLHACDRRTDGQTELLWHYVIVIPLDSGPCPTPPKNFVKIRSQLISYVARKNVKTETRNTLDCDQSNYFSRIVFFQHTY